jgi:hypothetical protein
MHNIGIVGAVCANMNINEQNLHSKFIFASRINIWTISITKTTQLTIWRLCWRWRSGFWQSAAFHRLLGDGATFARKSFCTVWNGHRQHRKCTLWVQRLSSTLCFPGVGFPSNRFGEGNARFFCVSNSKDSHEGHLPMWAGHACLSSVLLIHGDII